MLAEPEFDVSPYTLNFVRNGLFEVFCLRLGIIKTSIKLLKARIIPMMVMASPIGFEFENCKHIDLGRQLSLSIPNPQCSGFENKIV